MVVCFDFGDFRIGRFSKIRVVDSNLFDKLKKTSPYVRQSLNVFKIATKIVDGERPPMGFSNWARSLPPFPLLPSERAAINSDSRETFEKFVGSTLSPNNYVSNLQGLMKTEECQMDIDIMRYNKKGVKLGLSSNPNLLRLKVPGLAEKRPSVLYGDKVFVSIPGKDEEYCGYVHVVSLDSVDLRFSKSFHHLYVNGLPCDVRFSFCRTSIRRSMLAIQNVGENSAPLRQGGKKKYVPLSPDFSRLLFPSITPEATNGRATADVQTYNRVLNEEQRSAVKHALSATLHPYIIFGPPGTGKTVTLVEVIKNIVNLDGNAKVLVATPSNTASDLITERLSQDVRPMRATEMFRSNAYQRNINQVSQRVREFSSYDTDQKVFILPSKEVLQKYRIIVSTCVSCGQLWGAGMNQGHFTHILIDEAGQATEPETNIALQFATPSTRVVICGDPQQLGPVVRSSKAKSYGLDKSFLERLCKTDRLYQASSKKNTTRNIVSFNPSHITRLVRNYRSHPNILHVPSNLFYDGELVPCGNPMLINSLLDIDILSNKKFPVLFHAIEGKDEREGDSPSWFNRTEVCQVASYVSRLLAIRVNPLKEEDIGIITPYQQQVKKLQQAVSKRGIMIGSVEQFQGQEKRVIILSTVRSSRQYLESDYEHNLGFLRNPKRFNVAITRAKALMIVVGNPKVLQTDPHWQTLLKYCWDNNSFIGDLDLESNVSREESLAEMFSKMKLDQDSTALFSRKNTYDTDKEEESWRMEM